MHSNNTTIIRTSNNHANIHLTVEPMQYPISSAKDLIRVLQLTNDKQLPKFMVFVNKRREAEEAVERIWDDTVIVNKERGVEEVVVWDDMLRYLEDRITYFHSGMSPEFRESRIAMLRHGELWGIICTDAAGMVSPELYGLKLILTCCPNKGLDLPDVELIIQVGYTSSLCTLLQQFGQGACQRNRHAIMIYLVEAQYIDNTPQSNAAVKRKQKCQEAEDRKRVKRWWLQVNSDAQVSSGGNARTSDANGGEHIQDDHLPKAICCDPAKLQFPSPYWMSNEEYEEAVMLLFINACSRGFCHHIVCDCYFGNDLAG
ncbi:hypothetical protein D9756_011206 [Leucocoprinus leucothites]|uniref:Helicase C-terminal domain-containing protein n=1 Tax=Leucocoprinus leucothites TaxID=201217 RepID=A0A8H5CRQ9_9AGAR|nr:hypothetical protein D9756_011206 [Leucoagaricus leucothites]